MALSEVTTTFNLSDYIGGNYDPRRTKVYLTTNAEKNRISDKSTGEIRLGGGTVTLGADGAVSATTWAPGVDANPASWQTTFNIDYVDSATRQRQTVAIGPFTITTSGLLTALDVEQTVPAEYLTTVTQQLDTYTENAAASATSAAASASSAASSADLAADIAKPIDAATATALAPGAEPTVTLSGDNPSRTLNLGIPAGVADDASMAAQVGTGGAFDTALSASVDSLVTDLTPPAVDERISEVAVHSIVETGGTYPARPTGAEVAVFIGSTNPSGAMQSSDFWVPLDGDAQLLDETAAADLINSQAGALYEAVKGVTTTPQVFIPASRFRTVGGTATDTSIGAANEDKVSVLTLPGSVDTYIGCTLDIPPYMSSFQAIVVWSLGGSSSGAVVRWRISTNVLSHGVTFDARTIVGSDNGTTAGQYVVQRTNVGGPTACVPGETRRFTVARLGSSEATYGTALAGNAGFIGLLLVEAS